MGCTPCQKRAAARAARQPGAVPGTFRVMVAGKKVYEASQKQAAETVAERFKGATILAPGETE